MYVGKGTSVNWPAGLGGKGNEGVAGVLSHSVGALGYVVYEFAHRYGLQIASLENKAGNFVRPSERTLRAALDSAQMPAVKMLNSIGLKSIAHISMACSDHKCAVITVS